MYSTMNLNFISPFINIGRDLFSKITVTVETGKKKSWGRDEQPITLAKLPVRVSQKALLLLELKHVTFPPISF